MRAVVQRVRSARVIINQEEYSRISAGLLILLGVEKGDSITDVDSLARKIIELRIFEDEAGKMNRSAIETGAQMMVVSQFTLLGDCRGGRRPSFTEAAEPAIARELYGKFVDEIAARGLTVQTGVFQATMDIELVNQGPVTFILDSRKRF